MKRISNKIVLEVEKAAVAPEDSTDSDVKTVEVSSNHIYFYSDIEADSILNLNKNLRDLANTNISDSYIKELESVTPIKLHIKSFGGSLFAGLAGMDEIIKINERVPIHTIIDGCCASAGTFLSVAGGKRFIHKHAYMLIHQLSSGLYGKYSELKDDMISNDKLMGLIKKIYLERTKVPEEKIDEILQHDIWFDANECLEYGLVDEIL